MVSIRQILAFILATIGLIGTIIMCALPMWKVTEFTGFLATQIVWEGLWMSCVIHITGQRECRIYDSRLVLPQDLQAARAMVLIAIIVSAFGIILGIAGGKCTKFAEEPRAKARVAITAGAIFLCAGVLVLIPVCWTAHTIIRDLYNPFMTSGQLGASLYIGWSTAALFILAGGLLCSSCPPKSNVPEYPVKYQYLVNNRGASSTDTSRNCV